ncbi:MAG: hypothetical protein IJ304_01280 [Clostridia bacterium]|nr:hypothetical protein [Clostridia bacterium]
MFNIKRIICGALAAITALSLASCRKADEGYVAGGELVVIQDYSDIRLGVYGIDTLNPIATKSESVQKITNIVYESLFTIDESGKEVPMLAYSYDVSADGKQIEVTLKNNVKWHDGQNFTAEDVAYTLSKMKESGGLYSNISSKIHSFTATDKNTIIINFEKEEPSPAHLLTFPIISRNAYYSESADFTPIGTGSYKFISKSGTDIVLEPNSRWHEGNVSERKIIVKILKDKNAVLEAFNVGEIDAITSDELSSGATPKSNSSSKSMVSDRLVFLGFNTASPVMTKAVRKAINESLDRKKIVEKDAYGQGMAAEISINPESWVMVKDANKTTGSYPEDFMETDGYVIKDGVYHKDDVRLTIRLLVNSDNVERSMLADSMASTLKTAGFDVVLEKTSYQEYTAKIGSDDFDMFIGETEVGNNLNPAAMLTGDSNYFNFDASHIKTAMSRICGVSDKDEIKVQIGEFITMFYIDPPYLPLYFKTENVIYGSYVSGIEKPVSFDPYKCIEKWYFYDKDGKESKGNADE